MFNTGRLGDLIKNHIGGGTPSRGVAAFWKGNIPWASVKDFEDGVNELSITEETISDKGLNASSSNLIPAGNLIICSRMAVGRAAFCLNDTAINQDLKAIFPLDGVDVRYLLHLIDWLRPIIESRSLGSTVKGIRIADLLAIESPIAPKLEQPFVAKIIDNVNIQIRETEIIIAKLKQVKQGLLHDLLTRGVDENGALRPSYQDAPELYKPSELGWIPTDWEITDLDDALSCIDAGKSPSCPNEPASSGAWGVLKVSAVHPNGFKENENKVVESEYLQNPAYEVKNGDLLITRANTPELVGLPCLVETSRNRLMLSDKTLRLSIKDGINKAFIFFTLYQPWVRKQIEVLATGTSMSMKNISQKSLRSLRIKLPKESEQNEIYLRVKQISDSLRFESDQLNKLKLQKSGLMDDLLTGKKRVTNLLNKQPNS